MANYEKSGLARRYDWRVRLATAVGGAAGAAIALLWRPQLFAGFWLGLLGFILMYLAGAVLGRLAGGLLFRSYSDGPPDHPTGS